MVAELANVVLTRVRRPVARFEQIALRDDAKCSRGRQGAGLIAIEFLAVITVPDDLSLEAARELEAIQENIARVVAPVAPIAVSPADIVIAVAGILVLAIGAGATSQLDPVHLDLTDLVIAIPRIAPSRIVVKHRRLPWPMNVAGTVQGSS